MAVYYFRFIKPLDTEALDGIAARFSKIVTIEDGTLAGGLFGAVSEYITSKGIGTRIVPLGIGDSFVPQASQAEQRAEFGLDTKSIEKILQKFLEI